ncbi:MAG: DUF1735 domain-containing protein [Tannerellaceae bacterium]|jgi:hypothetical protein|nr:DUF1735 domain-containing protein [Tannerellaceae bacterium]
MKKYIKTLSLTLAIVCLTACLPDDTLFEENGSHSIVELYNLSSNRSAAAAYASRDLSELDYVSLAASGFEFPVIVNFTGVNGAPEDVTVALAIDESIVNVVGEGLYTVLPAPAYTLPASNTVIIPKGTNRVEYLIRVNPGVLDDLTKTYAIGIKITSASKGTISRNFSSGVYIFKIE